MPFFYLLKNIFFGFSLSPGIVKILITSYGNNIVFEDIRSKGINYLLTKPISGEEIEATMIRLKNQIASKDS